MSYDISLDTLFSRAYRFLDTRDAEEMMSFLQQSSDHQGERLMRQLLAQSRVQIFLVAVAAAAAATLALPRPVSPQYVECGSGMTDKCGSKCVDWTWFGACEESRDIYRQTLNVDQQPT